jgi:hypothetical protein
MIIENKQNKTTLKLMCRKHPFYGDSINNIIILLLRVDFSNCYTKKYFLNWYLFHLIARCFLFDTTTYLKKLFFKESKWLKFGLFIQANLPFLKFYGNTNQNFVANL